MSYDPTENSFWDLADAIDRDCEGLTTWECDFLESLFRARAAGITRLSEKQRKILTRIHEQRSPKEKS